MLSAAKHLSAHRERPFASRRRDKLLPILVVKIHYQVSAVVRNKEETQMRAIVYHTYGSPDVLQLKEVARPTPKDNEVLVQVHAASVNAADWHLMRGTPFLARFANGLQKPKNTKLGADVAGRVEAVGRNVTQFQVGDEVFAARL